MFKLLVSGVLAITAIVLSVGSALAFECYNTQRSEQGNTHAAKGAGLGSLEEILADPELVGLCPAGVDHVITGLEQEGFRTDVLINMHTVMAGGLERHGDPNNLLHNGKGIDHLSEEFFDVADALVGEGFALC